MTLREIISESKTPRFQEYGYHRQTDPVIDGHISYLRAAGDETILVDVPAKEWHYMSNGVVKTVGSTENGSLNKFLSGIA